MIELTARAAAAVAGSNDWRALRELEAEVRIGGTMWGRKGQEAVLAASTAVVGTREQFVRYTPFGSPTHRSVYRPDRVRIETLDGDLVYERDHPREAFRQQTAESPWDLLHAAYFSGYALWNYLNVPFIFEWEGVVATEIDPWQECSAHTNGEAETWRRLSVKFPNDIATHNTEQIFYYDANGLQRRHDYNADVFGGTPTAHYSSGHTPFDGFVFPTARCVVPRLANNTTLAEPVLVSIDIDRIAAR